MSVVDADKSPIFVVGTGRSGTTLLRMMLNAHPRIYLTHEASFYLSTAGLPRKHTSLQWLSRYVRTVSFAWLKLPAEELRAALPKDVEQRPLAEAFQAVMRCKARQYNKPRYGDKTPMHSMHLKKIFRDYPDARVVHIVRDPRGTVASLARMPWGASSIGLNNVYCHWQLKAVQPYRERIHEVRLEDLLADPAGSMKAILDFVGEPWDDAVLDHESHALADDTPPFPWFASARRNIQRSEPRFMRQLSPAWIRIVERTHRKWMKRYGYDRAQLDGEPSAFSRARAWLRELPETLKTIGRLIRLAKMASQKDLPDPQEGMAAILHINPQAWKYYPNFVMPMAPSSERRQLGEPKVS